MHVAIHEQVCRLPGPATACDGAADALGAGRSSIVLTGPFIDPDEAKRRLLEHPSVRNLYHVPCRVEPGTTVAQHLSTALGELDVELLLVGGDVQCPPGYLVHVEGLDDVAPSIVAAHYDTVARLAMVGQAARSVGRAFPSFLLCHRGHPEVSPPGSNLLLDIVHLHREVDELDVRCLVRLRSSGVEDLAGAWREHVLPPLAGPDTELLDELWEPCLGAKEGIEQRCREVAERRGWLVPDLAGNDHGSGKTLRGELKGTFLRGKRASGRVHLAFAVAQGDKVELERRLWRGQAALLLPMIDQIRLGLCERLQQSFGDGWPLRWVPPLNPEEHQLVSQSHLHSQLGHMARIVETAPRLQDRRHLLDVVRRARAIRNELAHYRTVRFESLVQLRAAERDAALLSLAW